jgi:Na+-translocating ferredoxin:NAD+ oxidoreductase RnfG subunit
MQIGSAWPRRALAALVLSGACAVGTHAEGLLTREEALALAYPGAAFSAERVFLTEAQQKQAAEATGQPLASPLVARYVASKDGKVVGRAYVDTHVIRTKKETLLISLDDAGRVKRVDVTAFLEPPEYRAPAPFLNQYSGRALTDDLRLQRAIRPIAGATLTANAVTDAVRRVLAIDKVLSGRAGVPR